MGFKRDGSNIMTKKLKIKKYGVPFEIFVTNEVVVAKPYGYKGCPYVGIAKCNPIDKFNLNLGIRLACLRVILQGKKYTERKARRDRQGIEQQVKLLLKEIDIRCGYMAKCDPIAPIELPSPSAGDTYPGAST